MATREVWKPIIGQTSAFVSNIGRVKYLSKRGVFKNTYGSAQTGGYRQVKLGKYKYCVHILVAKHFLTKECQKFLVVHHLDGCRSNNDVKNLEWTTQMLNTSLRTGRKLSVKKGEFWYPKFTFDGEIVYKRRLGFQTLEECREHSMKLKREMYEQEKLRLINEEKSNMEISDSGTSTSVSRPGE